jgi:hypothetical protein
MAGWESKPTVGVSWGREGSSGGKPNPTLDGTVSRKGGPEGNLALTRENLCYL